MYFQEDMPATREQNMNGTDPYHDEPRKRKQEKFPQCLSVPPLLTNSQPDPTFSSRTAVHGLKVLILILYTLLAFSIPSPCMSGLHLHFSTVCPFRVEK